MVLQLAGKLILHTKPAQKNRKTVKHHQTVQTAEKHAAVAGMMGMKMHIMMLHPA